MAFGIGRFFRRLCTAALIATMSIAAHAGGNLFKVPTRDGVVTTLFWEAAPDATATVFLFPGGAGGFGKFEDGKATGGNFLVRSAPYFLANGFNVAIFGRPNDMDLDWEVRTEPTHMNDVAKVLDFVKHKSGLPIWIIGTSRGTVSAAATAINIQDPSIAGLVLTASVVRNATPGAVPRQRLSAIKIPVLVYHHVKDGCKHCQANGTPAILNGLTQTRVKKLMVVDGGSNPTGDECAGQHWHGFIGMEKTAIDTISNWIKAPTN